MKLPLIPFALFFATICNAQEPAGLKLNQKAPEFVAVDQSGDTVSLKKKLESGPVVLLFYRGQWCPHCNLQLKRLEDSLSYLRKKGATVIAVTPETGENISKTITKTKASYPIIHDRSLRIMQLYDVAFKVDTTTIQKYKNYGIDFTNINGSENGANLPVPAVYIIDRSGMIVYRFFDRNYTKRPSVADLLKYL